MKILVTGGAKGVGAAIVHKLASNPGNHVYFTFSNSADAAKCITEKFDNTSALHCDYQSPESVNNLTLLLETLEVDVLVNNAFSGLHTDYFHKTTAGVFLQSFETNVIPTIKITQAAITQFRKRRFGKIINITSSFTINKPPIGLSDYVAIKNYIISLSKSWATENIRFNITSNCISPSFMKTDFTAGTDPRLIEQKIESHPLKRLLEAEDVADVVLFLTKSSQHINGVHLPINAGEDLL